MAMDVFGGVADLYEHARPAYPAEIAEAVLAYHGSTPASVVDIGAPLTCVEPDERMAAVWLPPQGGDS
ncbi:hypothetical protein [Micromonospora profundi]|uniref:hypothetical protein n=1 Tax=Micromonospora profundi TaxID=1420889 RepID=UPI00365AB9F2